MFAKKQLMLWFFWSYLSPLLWWSIWMSSRYLILNSVDNSVGLRWEVSRVNTYILWLGPVYRYNLTCPIDSTGEGRSALVFLFYRSSTTMQRLFRVSTIMSSTSMYYRCPKFIYYDKYACEFYLTFGIRVRIIWFWT